MADINATQLAGMLGFGVAALASLIALRLAPEARRHWALIAFANLVMAIECWLGLRHRLHDLATGWMMAHGLYRERHDPQEFLVAVTATFGLAVSLAIIIRARRRSPACLAAWLTTIAALALFAIETVSLHSIDAVLYGAIGPLALIGWLWFALGIATAFCARAECRQASTPS